MKKVVVLENIRSLHNVGSIFRTADSAGFDKVFLCGYTGTPPDRRIEKVSLGAEDFVEWEACENAGECVTKLKDAGYLICSLEQTTTSTNLFSADLPVQNTVLVLGNEVDGVSSDILKLSDKHLEIPMYGQKGSMNVSVAAGIAFYQISENLKR